MTQTYFLQMPSPGIFHHPLFTCTVEMHLLQEIDASAFPLDGATGNLNRTVLTRVLSLEERGSREGMLS